jgi:hypothetical protein
METTRPRPWFIAFNSAWDQQNCFPVFKERLNQLRIFDDLPFHQVQMPEKQLHTTVISLIRITDWPDDLCIERTLIEKLKAWLPHLDLHALRSAFKGFKLDAYEVRYFDTVTAIQFQCDEREVVRFRQYIRNNFRSPIEGFTRELEELEIRARFEIDLQRFESGHLHSAISRSPYPCDLAKETRMSRKLDGLSFNINRITLMISDESMGNFSAFNEDPSFVISVK